MKASYLLNRILKKMRGSAINNCIIHKTSKIESGSQVVNTKIDKYSFCGYDCKISNCSIGAFCSIADGVIIGGARHPIEWASTSPTFYQGRDSVKKKFSEFERDEDAETTIGNDVWIGDRAIIKAGICIGDGAIVGMGSVVTKDVGPYEIWAGNPAKMIKKRFDNKQIEALLASKWWRCNDEIIQKAAAYIRSPEDFLNSI